MRIGVAELVERRGNALDLWRVGSRRAPAADQLVDGDGLRFRAPEAEQLAADVSDESRDHPDKAPGRRFVDHRQQAAGDHQVGIALPPVRPPCGRMDAKGDELPLVGEDLDAGGLARVAAFVAAAGDRPPVHLELREARADQAAWHGALGRFAIADRSVANVPIDELLDRIGDRGVQGVDVDRRQVAREEPDAAVAELGPELARAPLLPGIHGRALLSRDDRDRLVTGQRQAGRVAGVRPGRQRWVGHAAASAWSFRAQPRPSMI